MKALFVFYKNVLLNDSIIYVDIDEEDNEFRKDKENLINFLKRNKIKNNAIINSVNNKFIIYAPIINYLIVIYVNKNFNEFNIYDDLNNIFILYKENKIHKIKEKMIKYNDNNTNFYLKESNLSLNINNFYKSKKKISSDKLNTKKNYKNNLLPLFIFTIFYFIFIVLIIVIFNNKIE